MVFNLLAGMVQGSIIGFLFSIIIYLLGHAFNLAIGPAVGLRSREPPAVHRVLREVLPGNGHAFTPLSVQNKYVDLK
jgi:V/A-type H+-transporting ATPase subunit I